MIDEIYAAAIRVSEDRVTGITQARETLALIDEVMHGDLPWDRGEFCTSSSPCQLRWQMSAPIGFAMHAVRGRNGIVVVARGSVVRRELMPLFSHGAGTQSLTSLDEVLWTASTWRD